VTEQEAKREFLHAWNAASAMGPQSLASAMDRYLLRARCCAIELGYSRDMPLSEVFAAIIGVGA
jgi:hypothetical protein